MTSTLATPQVEQTQAAVHRARILFVDDHHILLDALTAMAGSTYDVRSSDSLARVPALVEEFQPNLLVLDLRMPDGNALETAHQLRESHLSLKILFLSMFRESREVRRALDAGADGYVSKQASGSELVEAIETVLAGGHYLSPDLTDGKGATEDCPLTERQREVLQLISMGDTAKDIAEKLNISVRTAEFHRATIMDRLKLNSTAMMTRYALEHGITE